MSYHFRLDLTHFSGCTTTLSYFFGSSRTGDTVSLDGFLQWDASDVGDAPVQRCHSAPRLSSGTAKLSLTVSGPSDHGDRAGERHSPRLPATSEISSGAGISYPIYDVGYVPILLQKSVEGNGAQ
jgi:hypothetical protein